MDQPLVSVKQGQLRGKECKDHYGRKYYSFQGIPYARPPINELRFKAPLPLDKWEGVLDATKEGNRCYARHYFFQKLMGSEDCLFLNIYTPPLHSPLLPVMFWIHGGGYVSGSGSSELYGPDFLVHEDVVIVSINYRLGMLGFLSLQDPSLGVPGNAGLKDQVLALKWVKNNIEQFGGNPNNITIFGQSVGGGSVHYLMLSPLSKGLFHKAIIQSGSALSNRGRSQYSTPLISKALKLNSVTDVELLHVLKEMAVEELFELQEKIPEPYLVSVLRPFGFVVEPYLTTETFLAEEPIDIIKSGGYHDVPLMIGFTSRDGFYATVRYNNIQMVGDFEDEIACSYQVSKGTELSKEVANKIKKFFYNNEMPSMLNTDAFHLLQTDNMFLRPIYNTVRYHRDNTRCPIYFYRVSIDSQLNMEKRFMRITKPGACHADELGYLFKNESTPKIASGSIEDNGMKVFVTLWTSFAKTGNPNPTEKHPLIDVTWKSVQKGPIDFLDIGENVTVGVNPEKTRMAFWDEIDQMCSLR